ncbi:MAG: hypothetical protein ACFCVE_06840 [Phycisphaerae bacterium]
MHLSLDAPQGSGRGIAELADATRRPKVRVSVLRDLYIPRLD